MNILVTANLVPFVRGGAEAHLEGLVHALRQAGHAVEVLRLPFRFTPAASIEHLMRFTEQLDMRDQSIDRVISLQFPGYGLRHDRHIVWLMHQHRAVYELYDHATASAEQIRLRTAIHTYDHNALRRAYKRFANSRRVAERLRQFNGLEAKPLYHPPPLAQHFYCAEAQDYIFFPSRLERLKRQDLLIEAARYIKSPMAILLSGEGGQRAYYQKLLDRYDLHHRVRLLGRVDERMKLALYAHSLAVFFAPLDEDLGYVTLEAMLACKPVLTCTDAGGPLEFVQDGETGWILPPEPQAIAERIDWLYTHRAKAAAMGRAAYAHWQALHISWSGVIETLLAD
ncbi:MAG: glycosyltransferase family 4 protein [Gammaproteobacteria bacterium]|nr:glycosyltransferase family 4 protein [Gammaproteobacteria bacterium]